MDCLPHIHVAAIHAEAGYRAVTPGVGVLCREGSFLIGAGGYNNSIGNRSLYAIGAWQPLHIGSLRIGVMGGMVNGYKIGNGSFIPIGAAVLSYPFGWGELHLTLIPKVKQTSPLTAGFSFTYRF